MPRRRKHNEYFCPNCGAVLNDQVGFDPANSTWICTKCGQQLFDDSVEETQEAFSGVVWYCDSCNAVLNKQPGFADYLGTWTCTECGHVNSITEDDILKASDDSPDEDDDDYEDYMYFNDSSDDDDYDEESSADMVRDAVNFAFNVFDSVSSKINERKRRKAQQEQETFQTPPHSQEANWTWGQSQSQEWSQPHQRPTKFCKHCGQVIDAQAVFCPKCGCQVEQINCNPTPPPPPNVIINNSGPTFVGRMRSKWVSLMLCLFLGIFGAHKFYEGKAGMGILYICTLGLFFIGALVDFISLLSKPNPYYV